MHVIFVFNYKRKLATVAIILALWVVMLLVSQFFIDHKLLQNIAINNYITFSYPLSFKVENIFINEQISENSSIEASNLQKSAAPQKFKTYKSLTGKFSFEYPSAFELNERQFSRSEILYHVDFSEKNKGIHGFVQIWNISSDLKAFLEESKNNSILDFKNFDSSPFTLNEMPGIFWNYTVRGNDHTDYRGNEAFLQNGSSMYRISWFMPENTWSQAQLNIFWDIVKSLKIN